MMATRREERERGKERRKRRKGRREGEQRRKQGRERVARAETTAHGRGNEEEREAREGENEDEARTWSTIRAFARGDGKGRSVFEEME